MVMCLLISSGSKSRQDVPSSVFPSLVVAFEVKSMASAKEVFPEPPCAMRATFRNCSVFLSIRQPFQNPFVFFYASILRMGTVLDLRLPKWCAVTGGLWGSTGSAARRPCIGPCGFPSSRVNIRCSSPRGRALSHASQGWSEPAVKVQDLP